MKYRLDISLYSAPDRGDPTGGFYPQEPEYAEHANDFRAKQWATERVAELARHRDEIKYRLWREVA